MGLYVSKLKDLRAAKGWTFEQAATAMGMSRSGYVKLERGERDLTTTHIRKAAEVFGVSQAEVLGGENVLVPLRGFIGAGQAVYQFENEDADFVEAPPKMDSFTVAVEVRGDSMLPLYKDGAILYYSKQLPPGSLVGEQCIVNLEDGRMLVKIIRRGSGEGLWTLSSLNAPDIEDVGVQWAAPIDWIKPSSTHWR